MRLAALVLSISCLIACSPKNSPYLDSDLSASTTDTAKGLVDSSGNGIFGRKVIKRNIEPILRKPLARSGKMVFTLCVDKKGSVVNAELNKEETTITDPEAIEVGLEAVRGYRFEAKPTAPESECGKLRINIDSFQGIR